MSDLFSGIVQWELTWRGEPGKLPIFYFDNTVLTAVFSAKTSAVKRLLPHVDLHPIELHPGRSLVAVTAFEYRRTDIDAYNELSIALLVQRGRHPLPGIAAAKQVLQRRYEAFVWQLPVTTERARVAGVELYGYPKFLADIAFERTGESLRCELGLDGQRLLALDCRQGATRRGQRLQFVTYSVKDGVLLKANVLVDPLEYRESYGAGAQLSIGSGHGLCDGLRSLDLSRHPVMVQVAPRAQAILFGPRNLADD